MILEFAEFLELNFAYFTNGLELSKLGLAIQAPAVPLALTGAKSGGEPFSQSVQQAKDSICYSASCDDRFKVCFHFT